MTRIEEALKIILKTVTRLPAEEVKLTESPGRVLAEDIHSDINIPLTDNSAMDGYAVKASDTAGASREDPKVLEVIEDVRAGYLPSRDVGNAQSTRIMTGATIPKGSDSVIMVEETEKREKNKVSIFKSVKPGENIRNSGEDIKKGEQVLSKGMLLNSARIGILASLGKSRVKVARKPRVAILATGDEVIDVDGKLEPGKLRSSNTYTLYSLIMNAGGIPKNLGISKDDPDELEAKLKQGLDCDLIITSGGVSVGDYDFVKDVIAKMGTEIKFWKIAMKPGKPLAFGVISAKGGSASGGEGIPIFGLPGNPVSGMVSFEVFVRPAIFKMLGQKTDGGKEVDAILEEDMKKKKDSKKHFLRASTRWDNGVYRTSTTGSQGSGILKSMALANSLIIFPEEDTLMKKGARVRVKMLY